MDNLETYKHIISKLSIEGFNEILTKNINPSLIISIYLLGYGDGTQGTNEQINSWFESKEG